MSWGLCLNNSMPMRPNSKDPALNRVFKNSLVLHGGFEPSTLGLEVPCSIQLS